MSDNRVEVSGHLDEGVLRDVRVLELTIGVAGPFFGSYFAEHGADVIRLESKRSPDALRISGAGWIPVSGYEELRADSSPIFNSLNAGKRSVGLALEEPAGRAIFEQLLRRTQVVVANLNLSSLDRLNVTWDALRAVNPGLIFVTLSSFGSQEGPYRDYRAWGRNQSAITGLDAVTGWPDRKPAFLGISIADYVAGLHGVVACLAALASRAPGREHPGVHIDISQFESLISAIGSLPVLAQLNELSVGRRGNRSAGDFPRGVFQARGVNEFVAIEVRETSEWHSLCVLLGRPDWMERLGTVAARRESELEIEATIADWAAQRNAETAASELQANGVPGAPVLGPADLVRHPHLRARGVWRTAGHARFGRELVTPHPIQLDQGPVRPIPVFGEHTKEVLEELLGVDSSSVAELIKDGVAFVPESPEARLERPYLHWIRRFMDDVDWPTPEFDSATEMFDRLNARRVP